MGTPASYQLYSKHIARQTVNRLKRSCAAPSLIRKGYHTKRPKEEETARTSFFKKDESCSLLGAIFGSEGIGKRNGVKTVGGDTKRIGEMPNYAACFITSRCYRVQEPESKVKRAAYPKFRFTCRFTHNLTKVCGANLVPNRMGTPFSNIVPVFKITLALPCTEEKPFANVLSSTYQGCEVRKIEDRRAPALFVEEAEILANRWDHFIEVEKKHANVNCLQDILSVSTLNQQFNSLYLQRSALFKAILIWNRLNAERIPQKEKIENTQEVTNKIDAWLSIREGKEVNEGAKKELVKNDVKKESSKKKRRWKEGKKKKQQNEKEENQKRKGKERKENEGKTKKPKGMEPKEKKAQRMKQKEMEHKEKEGKKKKRKEMKEGNKNKKKPEKNKKERENKKSKEKELTKEEKNKKANENEGKIKRKEGEMAKGNSTRKNESKRKERRKTKGKRNKQEWKNADDKEGRKERRTYKK